ncbi:A disintegrin and metalloproteinase with thrombospondin motifs 1-like [Liolophura sinensis]|uniref:A disintegrin and metalloproteinase with thrombospondin motifs 1-like n=1 Tax=Liolophura sinensis TaxID=3198878 RepID=UPI0031592A13
MLITAYDINNQRNGLAEVGTICTDLSVSAVENTFDFVGALVSAHELGHSLGARHDGEGNICNSEDGFIMAATINPGNPAIGVNPWAFSACSIQDFRRIVDKLNSLMSRENNNCLLVRNVGDAPITPPSEALGLFYSVDKQCELSFGTGFYFCRSPDVPLRGICDGMQCCHPSKNGLILFPARGTTCGNKRVSMRINQKYITEWCVGGMCLQDEAAPEVDESCPFGDQPGQVVDGQTCAQLISQFPGKCHSRDAPRLCCGSCQMYCNGTKGCEFGDRGEVCAGADFKRQQCYDNNDLCCETCDMLKDKDNAGRPFRSPVIND